MSTARPLRLKIQKSLRADSEVAAEKPIARVWVDSSLFHLDKPFDYLIPEHLSATALPGVRIGILFGGRTVEGLIIERLDISEVVGLKFISSVISTQIVAPAQLISLIKKAAQHWIAHPYDLIRSAIPPRIVSVDKKYEIQLASLTNVTKRTTQVIEFLQLQPHVDGLTQLVEFARKKVVAGSVVIVVPEERELQRLIAILDSHVIVLSAALPRSERYENYLLSLRAQKQIIIGTRSAIFSSPSDLSTILIYRELAQSHYEIRTPGWNVRDLALFRAQNDGIDLFFVGYSPSSEIAALIDQGKVKFRGRKEKLSVLTFTPNQSELLPARIFQPIRNALKEGAVLFLVPRKGYASAVSCQKCRNMATCTCGGKLVKVSQNKAIECVLCSKNYLQWHCNWCTGVTTVLLGRGSLRHAEEIGRAFPGLPVINSDSVNRTLQIAGTPALVITTAGMAPMNPLGYSAVVLLEGDTFFSYADLRAQERSRETFFEAASLVSRQGSVLISIDSGHPISPSLTKWSPALLAKRELNERAEACLPPFSRSVILDVSQGEATAIIAGLKRALLELRIPPSCRIFGPSQRDDNLVRIVLTVKPEESDNLAVFLHEYLRHRVIAKKDAIFLRVDPYTLS